MKDEQIIQLTQRAATDAVAAAVARTMVSSPMQGTLISAQEDGTYCTVILDNDLTSTPQAAANTSGFMLQNGNRVMCLRYPPSGLSVIGPAGPPSTTILFDSVGTVTPPLSNTPIVFEGALVQHPGSWDPTNPTYLTVPVTGIYQLTGIISSHKDAGGTLRAIMLEQNGSWFTLANTNVANSSLHLMNFTYVYSWAAGTQLRLGMYHDEAVNELVWGQVVALARVP